MSNPDFTIYAMRVSDDFDIVGSLRRGEGRFGWSYVETGDLRKLKSRIDENGWKSLTEDEGKCFQRFMLDMKDGDYVVYVNVPERGRCTVARVVGPYFWRYEDPDFNHRFPVDANSVFEFARGDAIVHPALRARLSLQGRYWRVFAKDEFQSLCDAYKAGKGGKKYDSRTNVAFLAKEMEPLLGGITEKIQRTHPNYDLETFAAEAFRSVPGVREVRQQGGAGDNGADIVVVFESGLPVAGLQQQKTCVVQVKSFVGEHYCTKAVDDIRRAFDRYPEAETGLIISTAARSTEQLDKAVEKLRAETGKSVSLLIGPDVACFFLRYGTNPRG